MGVFKFKNFDVQQSNVAMKIGTDAVLLGAWAPIGLADTILDIGTGTGILALMLAQRSDAFTIDAIEIDEPSFETAVENFENSPWADRLFCYHASVQTFVAEIEDTYDFIIANPPYFKPHKNNAVNARAAARQTHFLDHSTLLEVTKKLLNPQGSCAFSLDHEKETAFINMAKDYGFKVYEILRMKDQVHQTLTRSFLHLGFEDIPLKETKLILKNEDSTYTKDFIKLTKEFYIEF